MCLSSSWFCPYHGCSRLPVLEALASTTEIDVLQAEQGSIELSHFLTRAPNDFLEPLLSSPFGRVYKLFLERCCTSKFAGTTAETRKNELSRICVKQVVIPQKAGGCSLLYFRFSPQPTQGGRCSFKNYLIGFIPSIRPATSPRNKYLVHTNWRGTQPLQTEYF